MKKTLIFLAFAISLIFALAIFGASAANEGTAIYDANGFKSITSGNNYYFTNDIDLGGLVIDSYLFEEFSGTIDGNGYTLHNFSIVGNNDGLNDSGIIKVAGTNGSVTIKDLVIGEPNAPIQCTNMKKNHGVLMGATKANSTHPIRIENVTIYANIHGGRNATCNYGGFIGLCQASEIALVNCKMYGSVEAGASKDTLATDYKNAAGFVAVVQGSQGTNPVYITFENCENYADVIVNPSSKEARAAGFVAYNVAPMSFVGCKNYGNITARNYEVYHTNPMLRYYPSDSYVAGFVTHAAKTNVSLESCENHGKLTGTNYIGSMVARTGTAEFDLKIVNCVNTGVYTSNAVYGGAVVGLLESTVNYTETNFTNSGSTEEFVTQTYAEDLNTTEKPADTTAPSDEDEVTTTEEVTTTKKPEDNTTKTPDDTTTAPTTDAPATNEKSCGSFAGVGALAVIVVSVFGCAIIKKK